jgi:hypothetical protein
MTLASDFMISDKKLNDDFSDGTLVILVIVVGKLVISDLGKFAKFRSWLIIDAVLCCKFSHNFFNSLKLSEKLTFVFA